MNNFGKYSVETKSVLAKKRIINSEKSDMRLFQKIEELEYSYYNVSVEDSYMENTDLCIEENNFEEKDNIKINTKTMYTSGLHIFEGHMKTNRKLEITWQTEGLHVRFFFHLGGQSRVENGAGNESYQHKIGMMQRNFLDTVGGGGRLYLESSEGINHLIIKMSLPFYTNLVKSESWIENDSFHQYILSGKPENKPNETLYTDLRMLQILDDIRHCDDIDNHRYHFLKLKLRELLFSIHQQSNYGSGTHLASQDHHNLDKVRSYLLHHLDNPPTSAFLARKFMMNEKKLKQDFKNTYGKTIYAYVVHSRMEKARKLLLEQYNVNELASLLGYQSVSHFIKVFKAHYDDTPKEMLKKYQLINAFKDKIND